MIRIEATPHDDDVAMAIAAIDDFCVVQLANNGFIIHEETNRSLVTRIVQVLQQLRCQHTRIAIH